MCENSKLFRYLLIASLIIMSVCLIQIMVMAGDIREMQEKQEAMGGVLHGIGSTVRDPWIVASDRLDALRALREMGNRDPSYDDVTQYMKQNYRHYRNGLMTIPNWISD